MPNNNPLGRGGFRPGQSGNPGGRGGRHIADLGREARRYASLALATLTKICRSGSERNKLAAAIALLDRGYGRPLQAVQFDGDLVRKKLNEMSNVELAVLEERLESRAEAGELFQDDLLARLGPGGSGTVN